MCLSINAGQAGAGIGFSDFETAPAHEPDGDGWARQMGIHDGYVFAENGYVTEVIVRNDADISSEPLDLMIIEILGNDSFKILSRVTVTAGDDEIPLVSGVTTYVLDVPLAVRAGDTFAHWSPTSGAVPLNNWNEQGEGGFFHGSRWIQTSSENINPGNTIYAPRAQPMYRDYFLNVTVVPEPCTISLLAMGVLGLVRHRRRRT